MKKNRPLPPTRVANRVATHLAGSSRPRFPRAAKLRRVKILLALLALVSAGCSITLTPPTLPPEQLDYRHWAEGVLVMALQGGASSKMQVYWLGESSTAGIDQYVMKIATDAGVEDGGVKNAVLIECGMHAREWFAAESCYWLIDWFVDNLSTSEVTDLLAQVDVWVLPQTNPAGRELDDPGLGDPTAFVNVCKDGTNEGDPCVVDADCNSNDCYGSGWRTNANTASCPVGIDLARNWSSGWNSAAATCDPSQFMKYRGPNPFSEPETRNLRRFVHNHMISTVLIGHTTGQETWNLWAGTSSANDYTVDELASLNLSGLGADTEAAMPRSSVGGGFGQYSAWLTAPSSVAGELDEDTDRNISTFFFEMPISGTFYYSDDYDGDSYQFDPSDDSNTFHPSSTVWYRLWEDSVLPMMKYVIRQAASPQCPLDAAYARVTSECESNSFGLVGMKIAQAADQPGSLSFDPATREETLAAGTYDIVYAVQNFSSGTGTTKDVEIRVYEDGALQSTYNDTASLTAGARTTMEQSHAFSAGHDYRVEVELDADDFSKDNEKSMAFRVDAPAPPLPFPQPRGLWFLDELVIRPVRDGGLLVEGTTPGRWERPSKPETVEIQWAALTPRHGRSKAERVVRTARIHPEDRGWKADGDRWRYRSTDPAAPIRSFRLEPDPEGSGTRLQLVVRDQPFGKARATAALTTSIRLRLGDRIVLQGVSYDRTRVPPTIRRERGKDDAEDEPSQEVVDKRPGGAAGGRR